MFAAVFAILPTDHSLAFSLGGSRVVACSSLLAEWRFAQTSNSKNHLSLPPGVVHPGMSFSARSVSVRPFPSGSILNSSPISSLVVSLNMSGFSEPTLTHVRLNVVAPSQATSSDGQSFAFSTTYSRGQSTPSFLLVPGRVESGSSSNLPFFMYHGGIDMSRFVSIPLFSSASPSVM